MENIKKYWKEKDNWGVRELILLLVLEFLVVIAGIKYLLKPLYFKWLNNELYAGTLVGVTIAITLMLGIYLIALRPKKLSWEEVGLTAFLKKDWILIVIYSIVLLLGAIIIFILTSFIGNSWENDKTEALQKEVTLFTFSIAFISAAIISPIYEEIFYRGFLYRWFRTRTGIIGGVLISSIIFTIVHIPTYNVMPVNFFSGIIFALAYERTNSIWPAIFIHGITNGVMVVLTSLG